SNTARAAMASVAACEPGEWRRPSGESATMRAASSVKLKRVQPNVAPARTATDRARSSAEPRDAPTIVTSATGGCAARNSRAAAARAAADVDVTTRIIANSPGRRAGTSDFGGAPPPYGLLVPGSWLLVAGCWLLG